MQGAALEMPEAGQLVRVRGPQWVVASVNRSRQPVDELAASRLPGRTLVQLSSVSDDALGEEMTLVWEVEPGREIVPATRLPEVTETGWDDPQRLGAFLDAVRWGTVASADTRTLQAPFRSGAGIEEYQLEPVARALAMPRVNLAEHPEDRPHPARGHPCHATFGCHDHAGAGRSAGRRPGDPRPQRHPDHSRLFPRLVTAGGGRCRTHRRGSLRPNCPHNCPQGVSVTIYESSVCPDQTMSRLSESNRRPIHYE